MGWRVCLRLHHCNNNISRGKWIPSFPTTTSLCNSPCYTYAHTHTHPRLLSLSTSSSSSSFSASFCSSSTQQEQEERLITSPELVASEYADLNLPLPDKVVADFSCGLAREILLVNRAQYWVKELTLDNVYFLFANAANSFKQLVSTYPGPLMLVSILCPDPHFKKRHHKRRVVQKPLVESIATTLMPGGQVLIQSDVFEVAVDMRNQFDAESNTLKHIDEVDSSVLCDSEGWLLRNPMGIRTEREIHAEFEGAKIYRRMYLKFK
ncbi:tRNA (guanine-N-7) methyltransferase, Trmb type [Parasponia andersonii]|uniref:tRNA (guanine(46)-N(7))-methyltransferase n=1 Tax=Parasponia andersonii TaxID=3476 RepID=A0A2P5C6G9_PARAD|nr:tRNA (guanine-N-7) methyltransferase, Trmb type [Parasponia andersonii]